MREEGEETIQISIISRVTRSAVTRATHASGKSGWDVWRMSKLSFFPQVFPEKFQANGDVSSLGRRILILRLRNLAGRAAVEEKGRKKESKRKKFERKRQAEVADVDVVIGDCDRNSRQGISIIVLGVNDWEIDRNSGRQ